MTSTNKSKKNIIVKQRQYRPLILNVTAAIIILVGFYLLIIRFAPQLPTIPIINDSGINLNTKDDAKDLRNRLQIAKINLEVPIFTGNSEAVLEKGVWNRWPERGNPIIGGNFILSAHRFELGFTPSQTRQKSPFFNIHKLEVGDSLRVFYEGKWYGYKINKKYSVKPTALYIENPSDYAKLTLYSCTLNGSADGRDVIEALPL
jgi:sortase A